METIKKDYWTAEYDNYLKTLVTFHGTDNWNFIATCFNSAFTLTPKAPQDCCMRWFNNLEPSELKKPWTEQEELRMLAVHQKYQNKWSNMAQELVGRSNNSIKNRFYSIFRKVKNKVLKQDLSHESKFELLETLYMIYLMELYFGSSQPIPKQTGKRGKDFIFSLLKGLHPEIIIRYKTELQKSGGAETSLDSLWLELMGEPFTVHSEILKASQSKNNTNIFSYITDTPSCDRSLRMLPPPQFVRKTNLLSPDEKNFIHFQVFQNKEPYSAGISRYSPMELSAGFVQSAPTAVRFEGFSDFTEKNYRVFQPPIRSNKGLMESEDQNSKGKFNYGNS